VHVHLVEQRAALAHKPSAEGGIEARDACTHLQRELDEGLVLERVAVGLLLCLECGVERHLVLEVFDLAVVHVEQLAHLAERGGLGVQSSFILATASELKLGWAASICTSCAVVVVVEKGGDFVPDLGGGAGVGWRAGALAESIGQ
jgi:hypothetical protein